MMAMDILSIVDFLSVFLRLAAFGSPLSHPSWGTNCPTHGQCNGSALSNKDLVHAHIPGPTIML